MEFCGVFSSLMSGQEVIAERQAHNDGSRSTNDGHPNHVHGRCQNTEGWKSVTRNDDDFSWAMTSGSNIPSEG